MRVLKSAVFLPYSEVATDTTRLRSYGLPHDFFMHLIIYLITPT